MTIKISGSKPDKISCEMVVKEKQSAGILAMTESDNYQQTS